MAFIKTFLVLCVASALLLCVAWQETECRIEERRLRQLEAMVEVHEADVSRLNVQVARLQSPQRILRIVEGLDLGLRLPGEVVPRLEKDITSLQGVSGAYNPVSREGANSDE